MLYKFIFLILSFQGLLLADTVKLKGLDTVKEMYITLNSESESYLYNIYYKQSKSDTEVLLDLYWATECTQDILNLHTYAKQCNSKKLMDLTELHRNNNNVYQQSIHQEHTLHCINTQNNNDIRDLALKH